MQRREEDKPISNITDVEGAVEPNRYTSSWSMVSLSQNFVEYILSDEKPAQLNTPTDGWNLGRCIVSIEEFRRKFKHDQTKIKQKLLKLENSSYEWKGIMKNYERLKEFVLKNKDVETVSKEIIAAKAEGSSYSLNESPKCISDFFPHAVLSADHLESCFYEIERIFVLPKEEIKTEYKASSVVDKDGDTKMSTTSSHKDPITQAEYNRLKTLIADIATGLDGALTQFKSAIDLVAVRDINAVYPDAKENIYSLSEYIIDRFHAVIGKPQTDDLHHALDYFFQHHGNAHVRNKQGRNLLHRLIQDRINIHHSLYTRQLAAIDKMMGLLFKYDVDFNEKDVAGNTAFHIAITADNDINVLNLLHRFGCGLNITNTKALAGTPQTPLDQVVTKMASGKHQSLQELSGKLRELGAKTWKEIEGGIVSTGSLFLSIKERRLAAYELAVKARERFDYDVFLETSPFIDFSKQINRETRLDYYRKRDVLADVFSCDILKTAIQSSVPFAQFKSYLVLAESARQQRQAARFLEQQKIAEIERKREKEEEDKKMQAAHLLFSPKESSEMTPEIARKSILIETKKTYNKDLRFSFIKTALDCLRQHEPNKSLNAITLEITPLLKTPFSQSNFKKYVEDYKFELAKQDTTAAMEYKKA